MEYQRSAIFSWREAIQAFNLSSTTKLVLFNLSIYMNEKGEGCYPSILRQSHDTNLSEKTICDHLQKAVIAGFLHVSKQSLAGQQWARNSYRAVYPPSLHLYRAVNAKFDDDEAVRKGTYPNTVPFNEGTYPHGEKALTDVHTNSPVNSPLKDKEKKYSKKSTLTTIEVWESKAGLLNAEMIKDWCKGKQLTRDIAEQLISEFRTEMVGKGKMYADFRAAFQTYLIKGYLSKTLAYAQELSRRQAANTEVNNRGVNL